MQLFLRQQSTFQFLLIYRKPLLFIISRKFRCKFVSIFLVYFLNFNTEQIFIVFIFVAFSFSLCRELQCVFSTIPINIFSQNNGNVFSHIRDLKWIGQQIKGSFLEAIITSIDSKASRINFPSHFTKVKNARSTSQIKLNMLQELKMSFPRFLISVNVLALKSGGISIGLMSTVAIDKLDQKMNSYVYLFP